MKLYNTNFEFYNLKKFILYSQRFNQFYINKNILLS